MVIVKLVAWTIRPYGTKQNRNGSLNHEKSDCVNVPLMLVSETVPLNESAKYVCP
jgi:hypothetical protein